MAELCELFGVTKEDFMESVKEVAEELKEDETYN